MEDPEYQELLQRNRLNDIPGNVQDRAQMQALIDEANRDLERFDRAISELEEELGRLKNLRTDTAQKRIGPRRSLLTPIRKLPPEIPTEIFYDVAEPMMLNETISWCTGRDQQSRKLQSLVFTLTWVCSWWRTLVISDTRVWSSLGIYGYNLSHTTPELVQFLRECFQVRAGNAPRRLVIDCRFSRNDAEHIAPVLDVLLESTQQWKDRCAFPVDCNGLFLNVLIWNPATLSNGSGIDYPFLQCPRLHRLELPHLRPTDPTDLSNLTFLKPGTYIGSSLSELLARCPSLDELKLVTFQLESQHNTTKSHRKFVVMLVCRV
ncbi:hypothetical protein GYMLUDRAFT_412141 [Collybiopsis luxurians FD-317 M1]|nr:hypothetical protein GYMLUDRAFT_412141 [Collybiopsis luxurians FD-317 M1]